MVKTSIGRRLVSMVAVVGSLAAGALMMAPAARAAVSLPSNDPFYAVPANVSTYSDGAIIASRSVSASAYSLPLPVAAWQVEYRTTDNTGQPTATVTTVLVPVLPWFGKGKRPIVSYQTAEDGVGTQCSPSYALRAGAAAATSNSELETPVIAAAMLNGWALAVPDYEGPNSAFLGGRGEGQAVLDGVRAVQHFSAAGLSAANPVGLWGYSGGSLATAVAAQIQSNYAPELHFAGIATGGLVADINATTLDFDNSAASGALVVGIIGIERSYPAVDLSQYLSPTAQTDIAAGQTDCITNAATQFAGVHLSTLEAYPNALQDPAVQALMRSSGPDGIAGTPTAPVYDYHATYDEFAPLSNDREQIARYCAAGATVDHVEDLLADHISEVATGAPGAMAFLSARFSGQQPINNCGSYPAS